MTDSRPQRRKLIENRDYSIRQDGAWVFTREYFLSRGTCCGSKCLNCPYENAKTPSLFKNSRPVISMVPSWTETLLASGANVVGRTRFCIHPQDLVKSIVVLGGTKTLSTDIDEKLRLISQSQNETRPLVILDREENPKDYFSFFGERGFEIFVSDVTSVSAFRRDVKRLLGYFEGERGGEGGDEIAACLASYERRISALGKTDSEMRSLGSAVLQSTLSPRELDSLLGDSKIPIVYLIWKNPWMVVSPETWIGEILKRRTGRQVFSGPTEGRYPALQESEIPPGSILLFSSEPYPFSKEWERLLKLEWVRKSRAAALVDGESLSWFGIRSLRFLEEFERA